MLKELTGVTITHSALAQDALRRAVREVSAQYKQLREAVRHAPFLHTDDTGWRVGGKTAFLRGFETDRAAVYQIRRQHRNEEVRELIPSDHGGVIITDQGKSYDAGKFEAVEQQKCLGHIRRNIAEVLETKQGRARDSPSPEVFAGKADELKEMLGYHLRDRALKDRDNQRLLNGLGRQKDCGRLLRFLSAPFVEPTNNRTECMLRPAVIAHKVSHCSKNQAGADAFAAFTSLARTTLKNGNTSVTAAFRLLFSASKISSVETLPVGR